MINYLKIGITGGIGSGKSTVCNIFSHLGIPVYNADNRAKQLMHEDETLKKNIRLAFGWDAYNKEGELDRAYLSKLVFNNPAQLKILNQIVHPAVFNDYENWSKKQEEAGHPYSIKEAALLIEAQSYKNLDKLIVVTSPIDVRLDRITKRDNLRREEVLKRIENQLSDKERLKHADFVIKNSSSFSLIKQVLKLHALFLEEVKQVAV
ncbi:MAG: dephospho-CoA kinase [Flavobacteriales bacterium]|nr:dephospho-CoA kinase [Flavobacteriales bacterium]